MSAAPRRSSKPKVDAAVFAALGDETRLRIVSRMCGTGPLSTVGLTEGSGVTRQAVTKHLRILEAAGLVRATRAGRETRWQIRPKGLDNARAGLDHIAAQWDSALDRLANFVEKKTPR